VVLLFGSNAFRDIDDPNEGGNAKFSVEITKVVEERDMSNPILPIPFSAGELIDVPNSNTKEQKIVPTKDFEGSWGTYHVTFEV
jgi:hypothetical protein